MTTDRLRTMLSLRDKLRHVSRLMDDELSGPQEISTPPLTNVQHETLHAAYLSAQTATERMEALIGQALNANNLNDQ